METWMKYGSWKLHNIYNIHNMDGNVDEIWKFLHERGWEIPSKLDA